MKEEDENIKKFMQDLKPLVEEIAFIHHKAYYEYKPQVENLIANKVIDDNTIQHLLDKLLDHSCNEEVLLLYKKLCRYYWDLNPRATTDYVNYYREMWDNEDKYN